MALFAAWWSLPQYVGQLMAGRLFSILAVAPSLETGTVSSAWRSGAVVTGRGYYL